jgi:hypothetical protein
MCSMPAVSWMFAHDDHVDALARVWARQAVAGWTTLAYVSKS